MKRTKGQATMIGRRRRRTLLVLACFFVSHDPVPCDALEQDGESLALEFSVGEEPPQSFSNFVRGGFGITRPSQLEDASPGGVFARYEKGLRPNSFEISKQHVFTETEVNSWRTGWRFDAFIDDASVGAGQEVIASDDRRSRWGEIHFRSLFQDYAKAAYVTGGLRINDYQSLLDWGSTNTILGNTGAVVQNNHLAIGSQAGMGAVMENSFLRFEALALGFLGYQHTDYEISGVLGQELVPGAVNRPIYGRATTTSIDKNEDDFAWGIETRLTAGAQLTRRWRVDAIWRWAVIGPVHEASSSIAYTVPNFSFTDSYAGDDDEYLSDLFLGLTYTR